MKSGIHLLAAVCAAFAVAFTGQAFGQGAGQNSLGNNSATDEISAQQEQMIGACNKMTGWDRVACVKNKTKEMFKEAHPCAATAMEMPCSSFAGPKRADCIKQKMAECKAKKQEFNAERKEKFMENHPCAAAVIFTPCSSLTGDAQKSCREQQSAKCKAKQAERKEAFEERQAQRKESFMENHPCAAGVIFTPCNAMTGDALKSCRSQQTAKCKAKAGN